MLKDKLYGGIYDPVGGIGGPLDVAVKTCRTLISMGNIAGTVATSLIPSKGTIPAFLDERSRELLLKKLNSAFEQYSESNQILYCHIWSNISHDNIIYTDDGYYSSRDPPPGVVYLQNYTVTIKKLREIIPLKEISFNFDKLNPNVKLMSFEDIQNKLNRYHHDIDYNEMYRNIQPTHHEDTNAHRGGKRRNKRKSKKSKSKKSKRRRTRRHYYKKK